MLNSKSLFSLVSGLKKTEIFMNQINENVKVVYSGCLLKRALEKLVQLKLIARANLKSTYEEKREGSISPKMTCRLRKMIPKPTTKNLSKFPSTMLKLPGFRSTQRINFL